MSQIATTIEQSKRLLEAGLDPRSADMKHTRLVIESDGDGYFSIGPRNNYHIESGRAKFEDEIPAWSLSRLIDLIADNGIPMNYGPMTDSKKVLEHAVNALEYQLLYANH